jgi:hypothetical protein
MENSNLELFDRLQKLLEGMTLSSETDASYKVFIWEISEKGELSIDALLCSIGYLVPINYQIIFSDIEERLLSIEQNEGIAFNRKHCFVYGSDAGKIRDDFNFSKVFEEAGLNYHNFLLDESEPALFRVTILERLIKIRQNYQAIARRLEPYLTDLQVYRLSTDDLDFQRFYDIYLLVGKTKDNQWIGFSTKIAYMQIAFVDLQTDVTNLPLIPKIQVDMPESIQEVISLFEQETQDVIFSSCAPYYDFELDELPYPFECFVWEVADSKSKIVKQLLESTNFVQIREPNSAEDYYSFIGIHPEESGQYEVNEQFQKAEVLVDLLRSRLREQKFYRLGLCERDLYIIGTTPTGDFLGISSLEVVT